MDFGDMIEVRIEQGGPVHFVSERIVVSGGREEAAIFVGIEQDAG